MTGRSPFKLIGTTVLAFAITMLFGTGLASGAITPTSNADALAEAIDDSNPPGTVADNAVFSVEPPSGNPAAVSDTPLALFPLAGSSYAMLSTGDTRAANDPNDSDSTSTDNGGGGGGHGSVVNDLITLQIGINVPANLNCLTFDYRFLTEEFDEFVGSDFNDAFLAELDGSTFQVDTGGSVDAPNNFAFGPDNNVTTVNSAGTSADNALGTTYDGATTVQRATTPVTPGLHTVEISIYDASDAIFDSTAFIDNLRLRNVPAEECVIGSADNPIEDVTCQGEEPTVFAVNGRAEGTPGDDVIVGTPDEEIIRGRGGDDIICGLGGDDLLKGNRGADVIRGGAGADDIKGNVGDDDLRGQRGADNISGQAGEDDARGNKGTDLVAGGRDDDVLRGNANNDTLKGRKGNDVLRGGIGRDDLFGGAGNDSCSGSGKGNTNGCE